MANHPPSFRAGSLLPATQGCQGQISVIFGDVVQVIGNRAAHIFGRIIFEVFQQSQAEMEQSFLDYAMSVIVSRALPDVRDGLKPVHRRILWAMHEAGLRPDRQHRKCATVVGDVIGKYHPHGDSSVYDALVRMGQDFSLSHVLIDKHGNFGSLSDGPAACPRLMRDTPASLKVNTQFPMLLFLIQKTIGTKTANIAPSTTGQFQGSKRWQPPAGPAGSAQTR